ncbi:MAG: hypothetical protein RLY31_3235 [Bacteroidota bacterium]|jgi:cytochrome c peroxidase
MWWNKARPWVAILAGTGLLGWLAARTAHPVRFPQPASWPPPVYDFKKNPLTEEGISLGRQLFYDPILSRDSTVSCSSCHLSYTAFTHVDHALSHGIGDSIGFRNAPTLVNLAWGKHFMWDGAVHHLDMQALAPISDPSEMGSSLEDAVDRLRRHDRYPDLFFLAFGDSMVTGEHLLLAMAQFQLTLVSADARYDRVQRGEAAFTEQEARGYALFRTHCNSCHTEPLFTNGGFANNGLSFDPLLADHGRWRVTRRQADSLLFKVPTLRNIEYSFPYMHDGRFRHLREVVRHYADGIVRHPTLSPALRQGIPLDAREQVDLVAFLLTLTDREFLFDPALAYPH